MPGIAPHIDRAEGRLLRAALALGAVQSLVWLIAALLWPDREPLMVVLATAWLALWCGALLAADRTRQLMARGPRLVAAVVAALLAASAAVTGGQDGPLMTEANWLAWVATVVATPRDAIWTATILGIGVLAGMALAAPEPSALLAADARYATVSSALNPLVVVITALALVGVFRWRLRRAAAIMAGPGDDLPALPGPQRPPAPALLDSGPPSRPPGLTPAEREIVDLLADGLTPKEIAHRRERSTGTVYEQIASAKHKLGARTIEHLIALGWAREA